MMGLGSKDDERTTVHSFVIICEYTKDTPTHTAHQAQYKTIQIGSLPPELVRQLKKSLAELV